MHRRRPMEKGCKVDIVSLEMDREAEAPAESQSESTLSNSLESGVTAETSRGDAYSKLDECGGWTNEKHNSYLNYLENSFVTQLYSLLGGETQRRTRHVQSNSHKSTDQFAVLQNGCWQKLNFGKKQAHLETSSSEFRFVKNSLDNPITAEASGQNFKEEEEEEEEKGEVSRKREREANDDDDSSLKEDQVVPVRMVKPRM